MNVGRICPPVEQQVKYHFVRYCRGMGLDLGYGKNKAFENSVALRERGDVGAVVPNVPIKTLYQLDDVIPGSCDFVVAADTFPKCEDAPAAVKDWLSRVKPDGRVCIYEPTTNKSALLAIAQAVDFVNVVELESWGDGAYMVLRKCADGFMFSAALKPPPKRCLFIRHGGIGDQLQAAYQLPELKRQGYHVTMLTTPQSREVIEHDPHVDEWFMVDKEQVPNRELVPFWSAISVGYEKVVNLNESCEGSLLTIPGRPSHLWPHAVRHKLMNRNYAEFAALLAEIQFVPEGKFYATPEEDAWAEKFKREVAANAKIDRPFFVMWVLAGSSPHKFTPHQDTVIKMIMGSLPEAIVVMVGNEVCKVMEQGWEKEVRVVRTSGELTIRNTLALAGHMDLVFGPETGVLNSVCYADVPKVIMLSHSSDENLTKHWKNAHVIMGQAPCFPCHRLHYTSEYCPRDEETHAAVCQQGVDPRLLYAPIVQEYEGWIRAQLLDNQAFVSPPRLRVA